MQTQGLLTVKQLAELLGISPCTVYRFVEADAIPFIRRQGLGIRFKKEDIDKWLESGSSQPLLETPLLERYLKASLTSPSRGDRNASGGTGEMAKAKTLTRLNLGFGAVYPRKSRHGIIRWYLDYRDAWGKRVLRVASHATTRDEAILALKGAVLLEHQHGLGITEVAQKIKFSEFSQMYLTNYAKVNKRSWRDDQYRLDANMVPFFGGYELQEITPLEIEKYRAGRLESGVTKSTINREITILKKMFNLAIDWNLAQQNPVLKVKLFSEKDTMKERILTDEEEISQIAECPDYLKPIVITALNTGMRRGEILNLEWVQVNLDSRTIRVRHTKSGKDRQIPINETLYSVLSRLRSHDGKGALVFTPIRGNPSRRSRRASRRRASALGSRI